VAGKGEAVPVAGGAEAGLAGGVAVAGRMVSVKVARPCAAGSVGWNNGPFWPQAVSSATTLAARASRRGGPLTRIWQTFNMVKL
jgi:hypothetical protein